MKKVKGLKIAAMVPLGFMVAILLIFAIGESVGGDLSGLMHLVPVVLVGLVIWLCWKRPLWGGILLLAGAIFEAVFFAIALRDAGPGGMVSPIIIMILPLTLSGVLLLTAAWVGRKKPVPAQSFD
jgi:hypothetical protein